MPNRLMTTEEVAADMLEMLDGLPPKIAAGVIYSLQSSLGGFPRDLAQEAQIAAMPDDEDAWDKWLDKRGLDANGNPKAA